MWPYLLALLILCSSVAQAGKFVYLPPALDTWDVCNTTDRCAKAEDAAYDSFTWEVVADTPANDGAYIAQQNGTRDFESQLAMQVDTSCNYLWVRAKGEGILWLQKTPFGSVPSNTTASILFNGLIATDWQWTMIGSRADENLQRVAEGSSVPVNDVAQRDFAFTAGTHLYVLSTPDVQLDSWFCSTNTNATPVSPGGGAGVAANYALYQVTTEPTIDDAQWDRASIVPKTGYTTTPAADMIIKAVWKSATPSRLCVRGEETLANLSWVDVATDNTSIGGYTAVFSYLKMNNLDRVLDANTWLLGVSPQPDYYDGAWVAGTLATAENLTNVGVTQSTSGNRHRMQACFDAPSTITTGSRWLCDFRQNERTTSGALESKSAFNTTSSVSSVANWGLCEGGVALPTAPVDSTPPSVGSVAFSNVTQTSFTVTATAADGETGISACAVVYDTTNDNSVTFGTDPSVTGTMAGGSCSATVTGLTAGTAYEAAVYAVNGVGLATTGAVGDQTTTSASGSTFYISASGSGSTCSSGVPCALSRLTSTVAPRPSPGGTWILKSGTYAINSANPISLNCSLSGGNALNGLATNPIILQAETERQAWLKGDGNEVVLKLTNCSYWHILGLRMSGRDSSNLIGSSNSVMQLISSHNNFIRRNLLHHQNRYGNSFLILNGGQPTQGSNNNTFEENEFYYFARYALISKWGSGTIARRNYCNSRFFLDLPGQYPGNPTTQGDGCIQNYPHSNGIYENNIAESSGWSYGTEPVADTIGNRFLGNISINSTWGALARYKTKGEPHGFSKDTTFINHLVVNPISVGFYSRAQINMVMKQMTIIGNPSSSLVAIDAPTCAQSTCAPDSSLYGFTLENVLALRTVTGGGGFNVSGQTTTWGLNYPAALKTTTPFVPSEGDSHITHEVISATDPMVNCRVWVPTGATLLHNAGANGADIGATVLYAYVNGTLNNSIKLWNSSTGAWLGAGATVSGTNPNINADVTNADINTTSNSAADVASRLGIMASGCFPPGY